MRNIRKGDIVGRKSYGKDIYKKRKSCYIKWLI